MSAPTRVLVVEDSLTIRKYIVEVLSREPGLDVVGEAPDGKTAIELCQKHRPDVVSMDMMLPVMTGLAATEYIMAYFPTPILIVSASVNRGELFRTYDALAAGAVDVLEKPDGGERDQTWERALVDKLRLVSRIRVITHPRAKLGSYRSGAPVASSSVKAPESNSYRVVAVGASTGGPGALLTVLGSLPHDFPLPILVVQHIAEPFGQALAEWLNSQLKFEVRYAQDREPLPRRGSGCILMAPPGHHLELSSGRLHLTNGPERHSCRPSVDVLYESLALELGASTVACLLTGMGKDGAQGLLSIRQSGGLTLAQDEETCVVFGMPGEAVRLNAASHVLPLDSFAGVLNRACSKAPIH